MAVVFMSVGQVFIESSDEGPVVAELSLAQFDGVDGHVYSELSHSILQDFEVDSVLVLGFGVMNDPIGQDDTREIIVDDPAVDAAFAKFLNFERSGDVREQRV